MPSYRREVRASKYNEAFAVGRIVLLIRLDRFIIHVRDDAEWVLTLTIEGRQFNEQRRFFSWSQARRLYIDVPLEIHAGDRWARGGFTLIPDGHDQFSLFCFAEPSLAGLGILIDGY
jgi:hypothetical protein